MLKRRVCICLLINDGVLFRTKKFVPDYRYTINHVGANDAVDEIFMVDITRSGPSKASHETMKKFADQSFTPITMGGHIKSPDDVKRFFDLGADKIVLRWAFINDPNLLEDIAEKWGSQAVTVGIDTKDGMFFDGDDTVPVAPMAFTAQYAGAGEIFLQSVERDGSLGGYDLDTLKSVVAAVNIPVVVGTSCGSAQHMIDAFNAGASGCATANIFHFPAQAMRGFKQRIAAAGVEVRV